MTFRSQIDIGYPYRHSAGPVTGAALAALRERVILGARCDACRIVAAPARPWCERCGASTTVLEPIGPGGAVTAAAAAHSPGPLAPLAGDFSWVLVRLDGADTDLLHLARGAVAPGDRVRPVWRAERSGVITDVECFEPGEAAPIPAELPPPVEIFHRTLRLPFTLSAGDLASRFYTAIRDEGTIHGVRCTACRMTIVPPRTVCARCWAPTEGWIPLPDSGTVITFVIVNVPFHGQEMALPYVLAHVQLDGADTTFLHVLGDVAPEDVRTGMRVEAVWRAERTGLLADDVRYFRPASW